MIVLGLTGSIGMGKSTAAGMLREMGLPVHDSDAVVHRLLAPGGDAVEAVLARFPEVSDGAGGIDRPALGRLVFGDEASLKALETILHPLVVESQKRFMTQHADHPIVVLDIPLLYETGADRRVDRVVVVTAPPDVQKARVLARGLSEAQFAARLSSQMDDAEKRARADFVVQTGDGLDYTREALRRIVATLKGPAP